MGFYHLFSGWLVFLAGFGVMVLVGKGLNYLFDRGSGHDEADCGRGVVTCSFARAGRSRARQVRPSAAHRMLWPRPLESIPAQIGEWRARQDGGPSRGRPEKPKGPRAMFSRTLSPRKTFSWISSWRSTRCRRPAKLCTHPRIASPANGWEILSLGRTEANHGRAIPVPINEYTIQRDQSPRYRALLVPDARSRHRE